MTPQEILSGELLHRTRRHFFQDCGVGVGKIALASLLAGSLPARAASSSPAVPASAMVPKAPDYAPKAKAVIQLFMSGGPSHLDLFDYKPALAKLEGKPIPPEVIGGQKYAFIRPDAATLGPRFPFAKHGQSGAELASVLPGLAKVVDDVCFVKSMHTEQFNHAPAQIFMNCGFAQPGRPCLGSWVTYGLGSESADLPAFVVMASGRSAEGGSPNWNSGFLPTTHSGVVFRSKGASILNVENPPGVDFKLQRDTVDLIRDLNTERLDLMGDPEIAARVSAYEMSYRLQMSAPELTDLSSESPETLKMYGVDPDTASFGRACLLARRMVERGVRFVSIYHGSWDAHTDVEGQLKEQCTATDQGSAALIQDLKMRGLLDETLVVWGGEFGRTPMVENSVGLKRKLGRDHHPQAFTVWLAGGGVKPGITYGATDELGFNIVENGVHIHDLNATILHLLGLDHERLTYHYAGRDFRLTDVHGNVVKDILV